MKKYVSAFLLIVSIFTFYSCNYGEDTLEGKTSDIKYDGKSVYLCNPYDYTLIDSTLVEDGCFSFRFSDTIPTIYSLMLKSSSDDKFPMTLPIVAGDGDVKVRLGEIVLTSGTKLNDNMQDFLLAMDSFYEEAVKKNSADKNILPSFHQFLKKQILQNKDNIVGIYIYQSHKSSFSPELKDEILLQAGEWFNKQIN